MAEHLRNAARRIRQVIAGEPGFTLIEATIAAAISLLIMGAVYSAFISSLNIWRVQTDSMEQQDNARLALNRMTHEIRSAYAITDATANSLDFTVVATAYSDATPDATGAVPLMTVSYSLSASGDGPWYKLMRTVVSPTSGSSTSTVADYIRNADIEDGTDEGSRDLFHYFTTQGTELTRPVASPESVAGVRIEVFSDIDDTRKPLEAHEATTIAIRTLNFGN